MFNKKRYLLIFFALIGFCFVSFWTVNAAPPGDVTVTRLVNPLGGTDKNPVGEVRVPVILGKIVKQALTIMGSAALLMFIVGGFLWLTSAGNADRVKKGTETMVWSAIGVFIIFSAYAILNLVLVGIGAVSGGSNPSPPVAGGFDGAGDYCFQACVDVEEAEGTCMTLRIDKENELTREKTSWQCDSVEKGKCAPDCSQKHPVVGTFCAQNCKSAECETLEVKQGENLFKKLDEKKCTNFQKGACPATCP